MAHSEARPENKAKSTPVMASELAAMGKKRADELVDMQREMMERLQDASRTWAERVQAEASLASSFAAKLTAARSVPEAASAVQEWTSRRMEMAAADASRVMTDTQNAIQTTARFWTEAWQPNGKGGGIS